jgi:hypothetical protein
VEEIGADVTEVCGKTGADRETVRVWGSCGGDFHSAEPGRQDCSVVAELCVRFGSAGALR